MRSRLEARASSHLEIFRRTLTAIADQFVFDDLTLVESAEACTFDGRDMDEHVLISSRRFDKPVAFGRVEPLDSTFLHAGLLALSRSSRGRAPRHNPGFGEVRSDRPLERNDFECHRTPAYCWSMIFFQKPKLRGSCSRRTQAGTAKIRLRRESNAKIGRYNGGPRRRC